MLQVHACGYRQNAAGACMAGRLAGACMVPSGEGAYACSEKLIYYNIGPLSQCGIRISALFGLAYCGLCITTRVRARYRVGRNALDNKRARNRIFLA